MIKFLLLSIITAVSLPYYIGTSDINLFVSSLFFGYVGALIMVLIDVGTRNPNTKYSPVEFDAKFFLKDNIVKFILDFLLVALFVRFLPELLHIPMNQFDGFMVGLGVDKLAARAKTSRDKLLPVDSGRK